LGTVPGGALDRDTAQSLLVFFGLATKPCQLDDVRYFQNPGGIAFARLFLVAHPDRRYAQTKKARVESGQLSFYGCQIEEIPVNEFAQFWVRHTARLSIDDQDLFYIGMAQTLDQDTFADHARRPSYNGLDCHA
jgi:hypothetical protein